MTKHQRKINIFYKQNSDNHHHHHHHLLLAHRSAISTLCLCVWEREKNWMNNGLQSSRPNHEVGHRRRGWNCCSGSRWENLWEANGDREELRSRHAGCVAEYLRACPQPWPSFLFSPDDVLRLLQWLRRWPACLDTRPVISLLSLSLSSYYIKFGYTSFSSDVLDFMIIIDMLKCSYGMYSWFSSKLVD